MKNMIKIAVLALSVSGVAAANHHENCEVGGNKVHAKDKAECDGQGGKFMEGKGDKHKNHKHHSKAKKGAEKAAEAAAPAAAPAPAEAPAAAPAAK